LPLSGLQHLVFCERQCALIHVEGQWRDNRLTVEGTQLHERVDQDRARESRGDVRVVRSLPLRSRVLGVAGRADVVEFRRADDDDLSAVPAVMCGFDDLPRSRWHPIPVEYKRGRPKRHDADRVQLCAQALCLEEMLACRIGAAALYYGTPRRRVSVLLDDALRRETHRAAVRFRELVTTGCTPRAERQPKCDRCSLQPVCVPDAARRRSARAYLVGAREAALAEPDAP
jgi:CRISPR-associated exonuclease Cas4